MNAPTEELLRLENVSVSYGGSRAVNDVSFTVAKGGVTAILGPNGVGKSSLARAISGLVKPVAGRVHYQGQDITGASPHAIARRGICYVPEGRGIFRSMSVAENLRMWSRLHRTGNDRDTTDEIYTMFPILDRRRNQRAGSLSGGEQQMLALSRAFCSNPKLIIADELSLGLAPLIVDQVFESLAHARTRDCTIIVIEQFVSRALQLADDCLILRRGTIAWTGPANTAGNEVQDKYLGTTHND